MNNNTPQTPSQGAGKARKRKPQSTKSLGSKLFESDASLDGLLRDVSAQLKRATAFGGSPRLVSFYTTCQAKVESLRDELAGTYQARLDELSNPPLFTGLPAGTNSWQPIALRHDPSL